MKCLAFHFRSTGTGLWVCLLFCLFDIRAHSQILAFPGAEGYGANALGGRGGDVYYVTNLSDSGPGSLREGITSATNSRTVLFKVSGNINLLSGLNVNQPRITIAGQAAPGDGICLQNYPIYLQADDLVIRHIRTRLGTNALQEADSMWINNGHRIIVDHCSASWSVDETLSATDTAKDLSVQWTYITESLNNSIHSKGEHGYGSLISPTANANYSFHHNLYAHHRSRSPRPGSSNGKVLRLDFRNNVIYNWGNRAGYSGDTNNFVEMNYIGNYLIKGPSSGYDYVFQGGGITTKIFQSANRIDLNRNGIPDGTDTGWGMFSESYSPMPTPFPVASVVTDVADVALQRVLAQAGAMPWRRDPADVRVTGTVRNGSGQIIDRTSQVGGWPSLNSATAPLDTDNDGMPDYWEQAVGLNPLVKDNNGDLDGDGFSNLEDYLNWMAEPHATGNRNGPLEVNLRTLNGASSNLVFTTTTGDNGTVTLLADGYTARFLPDTNYSGRASFSFSAVDTKTGAGFGPVTVGLVITGPNTAPTLAAISNLVLVAGSTLAFTNTANDLDQPPQTLSFSLSNPPAGAAINGTSGVFNWRPTIAQRDTTNDLAVIVWDNGAPSLSATQEFNVVVRPPAEPQLRQISFTNNLFQFVIAGDPGPDYLVEASTNLVHWETITIMNSPDLPLQWTDPGAVNLDRRFYRVRLGP